jgi:hypothetical protein
MKPYFKLKLPFDNSDLLSKSFILPKTDYDDSNPYIPVEKDAFGNALNCSSHNRWIHRFSGPAPGAEYVPIGDILNLKLVEFFKNRDLEIGCIFIFYACPGSQPGGIHSDWGNVTQGKNANFAINWTLGEPNKHCMKWYEPINSEVDQSGWPVDAELAALAYPIPTWKSKYVKEIDRNFLNGPTLVRTDIPHNAENYSSLPRWCFSIRTNYVPNSWQEVVERFKDIIED